MNATEETYITGSLISLQKIGDSSDYHLCIVNYRVGNPSGIAFVRAG